MNLVIVTGLSGSGKSRAINALEDIGYYCVDNLPPQFILPFAQFSSQSLDSAGKLAIVVDARSKEMFSTFNMELDKLDEQNIEYKLLYLDCAEHVLLKRYKETRRRHPLMNLELTSIEEAIRLEQGSMTKIKAQADYIIDTTFLSTAQLKSTISEMFIQNVKQEMQIKVTSFGFKYGIASDADLVFDVRYLPNPFYIPELREKTGLDDEVYDYVMDTVLAGELFEKLRDLIDYLIPMYVEEGKSQLIIAYGCTGGKHRSVSFARRTAEYLAERDLNVVVQHRDIERKSEGSH
ncbi:MAG: RNase adapter RapZ [Epulopiscium sp.]|nr:RNase adapter RapZ [Candidatus Epulonipiscium sp.]